MEGRDPGDVRGAPLFALSFLWRFDEDDLRALEAEREAAEGEPPKPTPGAP